MPRRRAASPAHPEPIDVDAAPVAPDVSNVAGGEDHEAEVARLHARVRALEAEIADLRARHRSAVVDLYDSVDDRGRQASHERRRADRLSTQIWVVGVVAVVVGLIMGSGRRR